MTSSSQRPSNEQLEVFPEDEVVNCKSRVQYDNVQFAKDCCAGMGSERLTKSGTATSHEDQPSRAISIATRLSRDIDRVTTISESTRVSRKLEHITGLHDLHIWFEDCLAAERVALQDFVSDRHHALQSEFRSVHSSLKRRFDQFIPAGGNEANVFRRGDDDAQHLNRTKLVQVVSPTDSMRSVQSMRDLSASVSEFAKKFYDLAIEDAFEAKSDKKLSFCDRMEKFVGSNIFELSFGMLILLNAFFLFAHLQYLGVEKGRSMNYIAEDDWPGAKAFFEYTEWIFGSFFMFEVLVKLIVFRHKFVTQSLWNVYDAVILLAWVVERSKILSRRKLANPTILRLARLTRLARLLRIVRWISFFDPLQILVKAVWAGISVLFWSLMLMVLIITVIAMSINQLLEPFMENQSIDVELRGQVYENWGTSSRAVVTMFEITLANWGPPCRLLMNGVNGWWGFFIVFYKCSVGFAVVQVITSVFIQQTFKVAARDEEVMIAEKQAAAKAYLKNLQALFEHLDTSGDGLVTKDEFLTVVADARVKTWFAALELEITEASSIFELLDDGDGEISKDEFIEAVKHIKGAAKGMDLLTLRRDTRKIGKLCSRIKGMLDAEGQRASRAMSNDEELVLI